MIARESSSGKHVHEHPHTNFMPGTSMLKLSEVHALPASDVQAVLRVAPPTTSLSTT